MKVLFVVKSKIMECLGPMYLSSVIKQTSNECKIVDIFEVDKIALNWKPDIIGFSVMTGDQDKFKQINNNLKSYFKFTSIFGGCHATFFPQDFENDDNINMVIKGEGEQVMAELLGSDRKYPDIDSFPWPDRTEFPDMKIRDFITSRGCPYNCAYCFNDKWAKMFPDIPRVRTRSVKNVIAEINSVSPEFVYFQDSCFGVNMKWLWDFSKQYRAEINIPFHCHLRPNQVNEERVSLLSDAGCMSVRIALETASTRLRKLINRANTSNKETIKAAWLLRKWGIKLMVQNILALPSSTIEDDLETLTVNIQCKPSYGWCSIFQPYPGTELGDYCKEKGYYTGNYSEISESFFDKSVLNFDEEHKEQLVCLQRVFALCTEVGYLPEVKELTYENFPKLIHKIMRRQGDKRLFGDIL